MRHVDDFGEDYYAIHEYYGLDDGDVWTGSPVDVIGASVEDLKKSLLCMLHDIDKHGIKDYDCWNDTVGEDKDG
jgi:hypothetical protein